MLSKKSDEFNNLKANYVKLLKLIHQCLYSENKNELL